MNIVSRRLYSRIIEKCPVNLACRCNVLNELPPDKPIDFDTDLNDTKVRPWKHLLILSHGYSSPEDWPSKLEFDPKSLIGMMSSMKRSILSPTHPVLISNVIIPGQMKAVAEKVYLYPDCKQVEFDVKDTESFMRRYLVPSDVPRIEVYNPFKKAEAENTTPANSIESEGIFKETALKTDLILICGHLQRDIRCGKIAPLLNDQFKKTLEDLELDVNVGIVSHIGGHVFAGNVIYYPAKENAKSVWYGRVFPEHVAGIIQETVVGKKVIQELYRGDILEV